MVKALYIIFSLSSFCFCQSDPIFFSGQEPSPVVKRVTTIQYEEPALPRIMFHYIPNDNIYISPCGVLYAIQCIDAALISSILHKIYYPSLLQSKFSLTVKQVKASLVDEFSKAKARCNEFHQIIEATEQRFLQMGYIPYLVNQVQKKVSEKVKEIVLGKVMTESDSLLFIANQFLKEDLSCIADKTMFFCRQYKKKMQEPPSSYENPDIQHVKETIAFISGKNPRDYAPEILRDLKERLTFCKRNGEQHSITVYENQLQRFESDDYLEKLILKIQLHQ